MAQINSDDQTKSWRGVSLWMAGVDDPLIPRPALAGDITADIAIIGAGYTGLWTAYYLKTRAPELNIAVLEAQTAGFGASGRNGGWVMGAMLGEERLVGHLPEPRRRESWALLHNIPDEVGRVTRRRGLRAISARAARSVARRGILSRSAGCVKGCRACTRKVRPRRMPAGSPRRS